MEQSYLNFIIYKLFGSAPEKMHVIILLAAIIVCSAFISNLFRFLGQWTIEKLGINTLQKIRNIIFNKVTQLHVGFFSNERKGDIINIRITNYFSGELRFEDGLPMTHKHDEEGYHGFGMKSMRLIAEKYGGKITAKADGEVFVLNIYLLHK